MTDEQTIQPVEIHTDMSGAGGKLFAALAKAQATIQGASKSATNPHFKSKYADLASVWDACREALTSNGIAVIQRPSGSDPTVVQIETILGHESGEYISGTLIMRPVKSDPQGIGSCLTYCRRYALASMVGVAPEDDDGNAASSTAATITLDQQQELQALMEDVGADRDAFLRYMGAQGGMGYIKAADYGKAVAALEKKRGQA